MRNNNHHVEYVHGMIRIYLIKLISPASNYTGCLPKSCIHACGSSLPPSPSSTQVCSIKWLDEPVGIKVRFAAKVTNRCLLKCDNLSK
jgi:hypothetical protein